MPTRLLLPALLLASLAAAGCSGSDEDALAPNTFTLRVDGSAARTYDGSAFFSQDAFGGQPMFGIALGSPMGTAESQPYVTFVRLGAAPRAGRYPLVDLVAGTGIPDPSGFVGFYFDPSQGFGQPSDLEVGGEMPGFYYAQSGTLTIDRIEIDDAVEGRFAMSV